MKRCEHCGREITARKRSRYCSSACCGVGSRSKYYDSAKGHRQVRHSYLQRTYGISLDDYERLSAVQGNVCAICSKPETSDNWQRGTTNSLNVDHDRSDGLIRGLLCNSCNRAIGLFKHDPITLANAIEYLASAERIRAACK